MTYLGEHAPDTRRGFLGSWLEFGTLSGYVLGAAVVTGITALLSEQALLSWGWRIPFLIAGPLGIIGLYVRRRLAESRWSLLPATTSCPRFCSWPLVLSAASRSSSPAKALANRCRATLPLRPARPRPVKWPKNRES